MRGAGRIVAAVLGACFALSGTLALSAPASAESSVTTASYNNLRDNWDPAEPALSPSAVQSASFSEAVLDQSRRGRVRAAARVRQHGDRHDREGRRVRPRPGHRGDPLAAHLRQAVQGRDDRVLGPEARHRFDLDAGDRLRNRHRLHDDAPAGRARDRRRALVPAGAVGEHRGRATGLPGADHGHAVQHARCAVQRKLPGAAARPAAARRGRVRRVRLQLRHHPLPGDRGRLRQEQRRGDDHVERRVRRRDGRKLAGGHLAERRRPRVRHPRPHHPGDRQRRLAAARGGQLAAADAVGVGPRPDRRRGREDLAEPVLRAERRADPRPERRGPRLRRADRPCRPNTSGPKPTRTWSSRRARTGASS